MPIHHAVIHPYYYIHMVQVLGTVIGVSDGILGLTLLAWGNSIPGMFNGMGSGLTGYTGPNPY